jgi:hypothetical protein
LSKVTAANNEVDYLVVAGGGGGGSALGYYSGGGGGAGGFREGKASSGCYTASPLNAPAALPVTVQGLSNNSWCWWSWEGPLPESVMVEVVIQYFQQLHLQVVKVEVEQSFNSKCQLLQEDQVEEVVASLTNPGGGTGNTPPVSPPQGFNGGAGSIPNSPYGHGGGGGGATAAGTKVQQVHQVSGNGGNGAGTTSITGSPTLCWRWRQEQYLLQVDRRSVEQEVLDRWMVVMELTILVVAVVVDAASSKWWNWWFRNCCNKVQISIVDLK